jgi:hypothetical protein
MTVQQGTAKLTVVLEVNRNQRVVQACTTIAIDVLDLPTVPRVVHEQSASGFRDQPVHRCEYVMS